jgi:small subunit ribosomal protein S4
MKIGPKYKIARRLGPSLFEKTQSQKFALRAGAKKETGRKKPGSSFGIQLMEKQKARFTYGVGEKQFKKYVLEVLAVKGSNINDELLQKLERRLDNVVYRLGFAKTRQAARQFVSHGHIDVNGKRITIPSYTVSVGQIISIRERSKANTLFKDLSENLKNQKVPSWLALNLEKKEAKVQGSPRIPSNEIMFDVSAIFQYYSR